MNRVEQAKANLEAAALELAAALAEQHKTPSVVIPKCGRHEFVRTRLVMIARANPNHQFEKNELWKALRDTGIGGHVQLKYFEQCLHTACHDGYFKRINDTYTSTFKKTSP